MYKQFFMSLCMFGVLAAQEPTDKFAAYLPNKYRTETYDMIVKWHEDSQGVLPRNGVIKQIHNMDLNWQKQHWLFSTLDVRGWTLVNDIYLGSEQKQPMLYAFLKELTKKYKVPMPVVLIPDVGLANMMAMSYDANLNVLVIPFGAFANTVWDTDSFEGFLAHEFGHIKHGDSGAINTTHQLMTGLRVASAIAGFAGYLIYKACQGTVRSQKEADKDVLKAIGAGGLGLLASWPIDVLITAFVRRRMEKRADRVAVEMGYGPGLQEGLRRMGKTTEKPKPILAALQSFGRRFTRLWHALFPPNEDTMHGSLVEGYGYPTHTQRADRIEDIVQD